MLNPATKFLLFAILILSFNSGFNQSYHALNGSPYAGVTGMYNNPATTVNCAYKWDVSVMSFQATASNSAFIVENGTVLNYDSATAQFTNGLRSRYFHGNLDINFFNFRMNIGPKSAFAFAVRGRTYNNAKADPFYYNDTISTTQSFLSANKTLPYLQGYGTHSGWLEADLNFSHILYQSTTARLSGGITLGYMRSLSGGYDNEKRASYLEVQNNNQTEYILTGGSATVEYSQNYDLVDGTLAPMVNAKAFLKNTLHGFNLSLGAEYLVRNQSEEDNIPLSASNYNWKIGVSIMDIGTNKFNPAGGSFTASIPRSNATDLLLQQQLSNITSLKRTRDSLLNSFTKVDTLTSVFTIANPTRLVINVDKNLGNHFFVNGELSVNFFSSQPQPKLKTRETNLFTVTPRWETSTWGAYLPVQYNTQGQLWVGAAIKLGPLLIGVHSLDFFKWFKMGTQTFNGGGYLVLNIHPFGKKEKEQECPPY